MENEYVKMLFTSDSGKTSVEFKWMCLGAIVCCGEGVPHQGAGTGAET